MWCCGAAEKNKMDTDIKIFFQEKSVEKSLVMREKSTHGGKFFFLNQGNYHFKNTRKNTVTNVSYFLENVAYNCLYFKIHNVVMMKWVK